MKTESKVSWENIKSYIQGNLRYKLFYSKYNWLIRDHIMEQIQMRILVMRPACFHHGACELCGCRTTALQMANKACDGDCYPTMVSKKIWKMFKSGDILFDGNTNLRWKYRGELGIEKL